jgi:hypothetical protein
MLERRMRATSLYGVTVAQSTDAWRVQFPAPLWRSAVTVHTVVEDG